MEKEGSVASYILSFIGGIYSMFLGAGIIFIVLFRVWKISEIGEELTKEFIIVGLALALYLLVLGLWILSSSFWMKKNQTLKKGALTSLILGVLSLNILAIVAGALGMSKSSKIPSSQNITVKNVEKPKKQLPENLPKSEKKPQKKQQTLQQFQAKQISIIPKKIIEKEPEEKMQEKLQKTKKISANKKIYAKEVSSIKPSSYTREIPPKPSGILIKPEKQLEKPAKKSSKKAKAIKNKKGTR